MRGWGKGGVRGPETGLVGGLGAGQPDSFESSKTKNFVKFWSG